MSEWLTQSFEHPHLDVQVQNTLASLANAKGVDLSVFVNDLLKKDIELIQMAR